MTKRMNRDDRLESLVTAAVRVAERIGYSNITREVLCNEAEVSRALVNQYFPGGMDDVKRQVVERAVSTRNARILAEAILFKHPAVSRVRSKVRDIVIDALYPAAKGK